MIDRLVIDSAYNYESYWNLIKSLVAENKTTGNNHSPEFLHYTKLNMQRMSRQDENFTIESDFADFLKTVSVNWIWLVIAEWWCGDVAQNLPSIVKIAQLMPNLSLKIILRDENLPIMDQHLTDGGRSIPILLCLDASTLELIGKWGPRPKPAQDLLIDFKNNPNNRTKEQFHEQLHLWYMRDKNQTIQQEFKTLIEGWQKIAKEKNKDRY